MDPNIYGGASKISITMVEAIMADLIKQIHQIARTLGAKFTFNDKSISIEEALSETGLLPAISRRADQLCSLCLGYGIGISFEEAEKTTLGVKVVFDDVTPNSLSYLCIADVIAELINASPNKPVTPLDELMYD
jgi:intracellular multiplication protein IcmS